MKASPEADPEAAHVTVDINPVSQSVSQSEGFPQQHSLVLLSSHFEKLL